MANEGLKHELRGEVAKLLLNDFAVDSKNRYFVFIGRNTAWSNETSPPIESDTDSSMFEAHRQMLAMKMVQPNDVYLLLPRIDWESGVKYDQYTASTDMFTVRKDFYVLTDENNLYKCVSNNGGVASVTKPTGTSQSIFTTNIDRYQWKFMCKLTEDSIRFLTEEYIPVAVAKIPDINETFPQFQTQEYALNGAIESYSITGTNTATFPRCIGTFSITPVDAAKQIDGTPIENANVNKKGSEYIQLNRSMVNTTREVLSNGFFNGYSIYINAGRGREIGQICRVINYHGESQTAQVYPPLEYDLYSLEFSGGEVFPASQYTILPSLIVNGDGTGAVARCVMSGGKSISEIRPVKRGQNYTVCDVTVATNPSTGTKPTISGKIQPKGGHGSDVTKELGAFDMFVVVDMFGNENSDITLLNDYRQFGLIKNPLLNDGTNRIAGTEVDAVQYLRVRKPYFVTDSFRFVSSPTFVDGNFIVGSDSKAVAKVVSWKPIPGESYGELLINPLSGRFIEQSFDGEYLRLVFKDQTGGQFTVGGTVYQYSDAGFENAASGEIISWSPDAEPLPELIVRVDSGTFSKDRILYHDYSPASITTYPPSKIQAVEPKGGELIRQFSSAGDYAFLTYNVLDGASEQEIGRVLNTSDIPVNEVQSITYRQTNKLIISSPDNTNLSQNLFDVDKYFYQYDPVSGVTNSGIIVSWTALGGTTGEMHLNDIRGTINVRSNGIGGLFSYEDGIDPSLEGIYVASHEKPETIIGSGDMLYIQNVRPIERNREQLEEFKIRIGF
jgi:hypothetical protein